MKYSAQPLMHSIRLYRQKAITLTFATTLFFALLFPGSFAMGQGKPVDMLFKTADTDGNGLISEAEWHAAMQKRFEATDTNHDGNISREELEKSKETMREKFRNFRQR